MANHYCNPQCGDITLSTQAYPVECATGIDQYWSTFFEIARWCQCYLLDQISCAWAKRSLISGIIGNRCLSIGDSKPRRPCAIFIIDHVIVAAHLSICYWLLHFINILLVWWRMSYWKSHMWLCMWNATVPHKDMSTECITGITFWSHEKSWRGNAFCINGWIRNICFMEI